jgi:hypothetical protein
MLGRDRAAPSASLSRTGVFDDQDYPYLGSLCPRFQRASHSDGASRAASLCGWHPVCVRGSVVRSKLVVRAKDGKDVSVSLADSLPRWTS